MKPSELQPASYKSAHFLVTGTSISGGRIVAKKKFIGTDRQQVEDLGLKLRSFTLNGTIASRRDALGNEIQTYREVREALLSALERGGTGVLVHPFYGEIYNVKATTYNLSERTTLLGDASIDIQFEISNADGRPEPEENTLSSIETQLDSLVVAVNLDIASAFSVTGTFAGNFTAAIDKANGYVDAVQDSAKFLSVGAAALDKFSNQISDFSTNVVALINAPQEFADSITGLMLTVKGLSTSATGIFDAFTQLFDFGENDSPINQTTPSLIERKKNNDTVNTATQSLALAYAYLSSSEITYANTDEIGSVEAITDKQYQKLVNSPLIDVCVIESMTDLRRASQAFFSEQRDLRPRVVTVNTSPTSTRLLAFSNYGSSELGPALARLNKLNQSAYVEGDVKILSP